MSVELRLLAAFVAVAEEGTFTAAARRLTVTQPALSRRIVQLERQLGVAVLRRTTRSTELTAAGEALLDHARTAIASAEAGVRAAREAADIDAARELRVVLSRNRDGSVPVAALSGLRARFPALTVAVDRSKTGPAIRAVLEHRADVAFVRGLPDDADEHLRTEVVLQEELLAVLPAGHPLAAAATVPVERFRREPVVFFSGEDELCTPHTVRELWGEEASVPSRAVALRPDIDAMIEEVAARGDALTIAYASNVARAQSLGLVARPLAPARFRPLFLVRRRDDRRPHVLGFVDQVRSATRDQSAARAAVPPLRSVA
ncbi:putative lysR-type transcriptional regulator [Patulibacter medicamentivorans]|uniref:Putative lysR-type transcriptional regulator n=1 Tax=Patulibacter medicamentivorans TaxID=1097667 RepID=H0EAM1_9ACTN|nr:LysR substrate-binding domain-containing protein [Patulibacter medicamentivorans]EHN09255.1 putative lysR-type transcriptional regulator [Patulibacter medicamentivorans]